MAEEVEQYNVQVSEDTFRIKEEFGDDGYKVFISETAISTSDSQSKEYIKSELTTPDIKMETPAVYCHTINESIKIEEDVHITHVKIENDMENKLLFCDDCHAYYQDYCTTCGMLAHILNRNIPKNTDNKSHEEMPQHILEIRDSFGQPGIFALKVIPEGVKFGPFIGLDTSQCPWKIKGGRFAVNEEISKFLNWMQYIKPVRSIYQSNLHLFQYIDKLYYETNREICEGEELLVHLGEEYNDSFENELEMDFTPIVRDNTKDVFACTFCCLGFSSKKCLAKHKSICCSKTDEEFSIEELLQCPLCKIYLAEKEYSEHHMGYCFDRNVSKCDPLALNIQTNPEAIQPKNRPVQTQTNYECPSCAYRTNYKQHLNVHIKTKHLKEFNYKCDLCNYKTNHSPSLRSHIKTQHNKEFAFNCEACEFKTNRKTSLKKHMNTKHLKEFAYKCDRCEFKTNYKAHLEKHVKTKHLNEFDYKCEHCEFGSNQKVSLVRHVEGKHLKEFKYKCPSCEHRTNHKHSLKTHINTKHVSEFSFKCEFCKFKTNYKGQFEKHMQTKHRKEHTYKCVKCAFKTNYKTCLKAHVKTIHLKEFNYKCDWCDYKTNSKTTLTVHVKTKHLKEFSYICESCEYKTNHKINLERHVEVHH